MDRVVAAQPELIGKLAGPTGQVLIDTDHEQLRVGRLQVLDRPAVARRGETRCAPGCGERRTSLRVGQETRRDRVG
jgi:hypothetical protein